MSCSVGELPVSSTSSSSGSVGGGGCRLRGVAASPMGATVPSQVAAGARRAMPPQPNKPCCFCWCCCCSCSWAKCLAIKNAEDNGPMKKDPASTDLLNCSGEPPSLEEIRTWGKSFEKLMKSDAGREFFRKFLCLEFSEENILFWLACEELKRHEHDLPEDIVEEKARKIYEDYISILSPKEVSLDSRVREIVNKNMVKPTTHTFDEAQLQIYTLMHRDSYPRFVNSPQYKLLAQLQSTNSTEGDAGPQSSLGAISAPESPQSDRKTTTQ